MNIAAKDFKTVMLLARRAERKAGPLVAQVEGATLHVNMVTGHDPHIDIAVHNPNWSGCFLEICLRSTAEVDAALSRLEDYVDAKLNEVAA